jgi:hypothetical protein
LCLLVYVGGVSVPALYGPMARSCRKVWENTNLNRLVSKRLSLPGAFFRRSRRRYQSRSNSARIKKIGCLAAPALERLGTHSAQTSR